MESLLHENPSFCKSVGEELSSCDFREALETFFPGFNVAKNYKLDYLLSDFIAGITVGLTVIPQGIAYAILAELPPEVRWFARVDIITSLTWEKPCTQRAGNGEVCNLLQIFPASCT